MPLMLCFGQSVLAVGCSLRYLAFSLLTSIGLDLYFLGAGSLISKHTAAVVEWRAVEEYYNDSWFSRHMQ